MKAKLIFLSLLGVVSTTLLAADTNYHVTQRLPLGAATKWDYAAVAVERQRLFVTRGDHVDVVDIPSGKMSGTIPNTLGVHGVAFAADLKLGFTSNGKANSVTVFDLDSLKTTAEIALTGKNPDAILYEPSVHKLYVFNGGSANVDVVDVTTLKVVTTIKATGRPEFAVADAEGKIYFNIEDNAGINVIDSRSDKLVSTWKLEGCDGPTGLAIDRRNSRLFSACGNGIMAVTDAKSGQRVAQFAIGEHPDAVVYDADTHTILTSCGGGTGTLAIARQDDADHYTPQASVITEKKAKPMAMDMKTKTVYLPTVVDDKFVLVVAERRK